MKNKKEQFLEAVRILAPGNELFLKLAMRVKEEELPRHPGGVALEFVAALEKLSGCGAESFAGRGKAYVPEDPRAERKSRWACTNAPQPRRGCRSRAFTAGDASALPGMGGGVAMAA